MKSIELSEVGCLILGTLMQPTHGYEIMKVIESELAGKVSLGPATLYTTLSKLEKGGLCSYEEVANKKIYTITKEGIELLYEETQKKNQILNYMMKCLENGGIEL